MFTFYIMKVFTFSMSKINYPLVRRDEEKYDCYHGIKIPNPYHWLEDPDSEETTSFVKSQNTLSEPFIKNGSIRTQYKDRYVFFPLML